MGDVGGFLHVVEVDLDETRRDGPDDFHPVPGGVFPGSAGAGLLGDGDARGVVDEEDLVRMRVGLFAEVDVVEIRRILVAEDDAHVAVTARGLFGHDAGGEDEVADNASFADRDVDRTAVGWVVLRAAEDFEGGIAVGLGDLPCLRVGGSPGVGTFRKVVRKDHGQLRGGEDRGEREKEEEQGDFPHRERWHESEDLPVAGESSPGLQPA